MGTKTISIMDDVYEKLMTLKKPDESFSDELRRLADKQSTGKSLKEFAGAWKNMSKEEEENIKEGIKKAQMRFSDILKKWES